jgi:hypothetical protein
MLLERHGRDLESHDERVARRARAVGPREMQRAAVVRRCAARGQRTRDSRGGFESRGALDGVDERIVFR